MNRFITIGIACAVLGLMVPKGFGQVRLEDNFNYPAGDSLKLHSWAITSGSNTNAILVTSPGLTYTGYPSSGIGNAVRLANTGQDLSDTLTSPVSSGAVYASLLVRVDTARTGDYFFHLQPTSAPTTGFYARVFVRKANNSNLTFGMTKTTNNATFPINYTDSVYTAGVTYLIVAKYAFGTPADTADDQVSLFIFTSPTLPATEPAPTLGPLTTVQKDPADIKFIGIRQGTASSSPNVTIDGIRVGVTWNDAPLPVQLSSFTGTYRQADNSVMLKWRTISEINNYGFYVQRSSDRISPTVVSPLIAGHGTTNAPQDYSFVDVNVPQTSSWYRVKQVDLDASVNYSEWIHVDPATPTSVGENTPKVFTLQQNYPNPFNPETNIKFSVATTGSATLRVFNLIGQEVATLYNDLAQAGKTYSIPFNAPHLNSGVYFYKLESGNNVATRKLMLLK